MYADKEKFVTSAYKQKMLEMQEEEEKERREAAFEGTCYISPKLFGVLLERKRPS